MKLCECGCQRPTSIAIQTDRRRGWIKDQPIRFCNGHNRSTLSHGQAKRGMVNPIYSAFKEAKMRCNNPNNEAYKYYGGRGIKFLFTGFKQFMDHIGPKPSPELTIDRINNDGNYEPGNVRWATWQQQRANQRRDGR